MLAQPSSQRVLGAPTGQGGPGRRPSPNRASRADVAPAPAPGPPRSPTCWPHCGLQTFPARPSPHSQLPSWSELVGLGRGSPAEPGQRSTTARSQLPRLGSARLAPGTTGGPRETREEPAGCKEQKSKQQAPGQEPGRGRAGIGRLGVCLSVRPSAAGRPWPRSSPSLKHGVTCPLAGVSRGGRPLSALSPHTVAHAAGGSAQPGPMHRALARSLARSASPSWLRAGGRVNGSRPPASGVSSPRPSRTLAHPEGCALRSARPGAGFPTNFVGEGSGRGEAGGRGRRRRAPPLARAHGRPAGQAVPGGRAGGPATEPRPGGRPAPRELAGGRAERGR